MPSPDRHFATAAIFTQSTGTNTILAEYVQSPVPKEDWGNPPFSFSETVTEAFNILNS
jgi:hypothetical protein